MESRGHKGEWVTERGQEMGLGRKGYGGDHRLRISAPPRPRLPEVFKNHVRPSNP